MQATCGRGGTEHVWQIQEGRCSGTKAYEGGPEMLLLLLALLVILALFGAGFALHLLWWVAIVALVVWVVGFFMRRAVSPRHRSWPRH